MDWDPYPGSALPTDVALGKASSFQPSHFIWKKKMIIPILPDSEDLNCKCQMSRIVRPTGGP